MEQKKTGFCLLRNMLYGNKIISIRFPQIFLPDDKYSYLMTDMHRSPHVNVPCFPIIFTVLYRTSLRIPVCRYDNIRLFVGRILNCNAAYSPAKIKPQNLLRKTPARPINSVCRYFTYELHITKQNHFKKLPTNIMAGMVARQQEFEDPPPCGRRRGSGGRKECGLRERQLRRHRRTGAAGEKAKQRQGRREKCGRCTSAPSKCSQ